MKNLNLLRMIVQGMEKQLAGEATQKIPTIHEDTELKDKELVGIKKGIIKAVKDENLATKELHKNPFKKNKRVPVKKA